MQSNEHLEVVAKLVDEYRHRVAVDFREHAGCVERVCEFMDGLLAKLAETNLWGEANRIPSGIVWQMEGLKLSRGWLQNHARTKPRGYAGDFEMLQKICDNWHCDDELGHAYDVYFQRQLAPQAVRGRTELLAQKIVDGVLASNSTFKVVSIGSGAAVEITRAVNELATRDRARLQVVLLDLDPSALEHASQKLSSNLSSEQVCALRENLFRLDKKPSVLEAIQDANLIYCAGLFDYLDEKNAMRMLKLMHESLTQDGELLAFNFGTNNPSRAYMEWIGNWYLIYRDQDDLAELASRAEINEFSIGAESSKINLFIHARV